MLDNLSQQSHPRLWLLFQHFFGATRDKRLIAISNLSKHHSVLEIGCSLGVVSSAFTKIKNISYLGVDIDDQAIQFAKKKFSSFTHMEFANISLEELALTERKFDYVLFANILHHVDDGDAYELLKQAVRVLNQGGTMVIMEPDILGKEDSFLVKMLYRLERGLYRRPLDKLLSLVSKAGIAVGTVNTKNVSIGLLPGIVCGRMQVITVLGGLSN